jgi:uncharacterized protein involved in exopolysaccharide biosynthesis
MSAYEMLKILWEKKWKILLITCGTGALTLGMGFLQGNVYQASALIKPVEEKDGGGGLSQLGGALGGLGIEIGGTSDIQTVGIILKSRELAARVFQKDSLFQRLFPETERNGNNEPSLRERMGGVTNKVKGPTDWDYIRAAGKYLGVQIDKKTGTITVSFVSSSPTLAAEVVNTYLSTAKDMLQEQAFERASNNKKFLEEQIRKTFDAMTKERIYLLYNKEIEKEMLARNREQFGFIVIDPPRIPDRKFGPHRLIRAIFVSFVAFLGYTFYLLFLDGVWRQHVAKSQEISGHSFEKREPLA